MRSIDPLNDISFAMHDAPQRILPDKDHVRVRDMDYMLFCQMWGSTALGFGGIAGQAMTVACTVLVTTQSQNRVAVYFGTRHAYTVIKPNQTFYEDIKNRHMKRVADADAYGEEVIK